MRIESEPRIIPPKEFAEYFDKELERVRRLLSDLRADGDAAKKLPDLYCHQLEVYGKIL